MRASGLFVALVWLVLAPGCGEVRQSCAPSKRAIGSCECSADADCVAQTEAMLDELRKPRQLDRRFAGAECVARDPNVPGRCCFARPAVCLCHFVWGNSNQISPQNAIGLGGRTTCDVEGRGMSCLFPSQDFKGCDPAVASSCDLACADLVFRIARDDAKVFDVERRTTRCEPGSCGLCRSVFRIGDRCFASRSPGATAYDCSLGDEAILAAQYGPPAAPSPPPQPAASTSSPPPPPPPAATEQPGVCSNP